MDESVAVATVELKLDLNLVLDLNLNESELEWERIESESIKFDSVVLSFLLLLLLPFVLSVIVSLSWSLNPSFDSRSSSPYFDCSSTSLDESRVRLVWIGMKSGKIFLLQRSEKTPTRNRYDVDRWTSSAFSFSLSEILDQVLRKENFQRRKSQRRGDSAFPCPLGKIAYESEEEGLLQRSWKKRIFNLDVWSGKIWRTRSFSSRERGKKSEERNSVLKRDFISISCPLKKFNEIQTKATRQRQRQREKWESKAPTG